jgi:hypothetical protein
MEVSGVPLTMGISLVRGLSWPKDVTLPESVDIRTLVEGDSVTNP